MTVSFTTDGNGVYFATVATWTVCKHYLLNVERKKNQGYEFSVSIYPCFGFTSCGNKDICSAQVDMCRLCVGCVSCMEVREWAKFLTSEKQRFPQLIWAFYQEKCLHLQKRLLKILILKRDYMRFFFKVHVPTRASVKTTKCLIQQQLPLHCYPYRQREGNTAYIEHFCTKVNIIFLIRRQSLLKVEGHGVDGAVMSTAFNQRNKCNTYIRQLYFGLCPVK